MLKVAQDSTAAWDLQETYADLPHGWIQWKGTDVCMDVHCSCGELTHIDDQFTYNIKCGSCGKSYFVNGHVELIELQTEPDNVKTTDCN